MPCPDEEGIETVDRSAALSLNNTVAMPCPDEEGIETNPVLPQRTGLTSVAMPCPDEEGIETLLTGDQEDHLIEHVAMPCPDEEGIETAEAASSRPNPAFSSRCRASMKRGLKQLPTNVRCLV